MKHTIEFREEEQAQILKAQRGDDRALSNLLRQYEKFAIDLGGTHAINPDDASGIYFEKFMPALHSWKAGDAVFAAYLKVVLNRAFISFNRPKHRGFISIDSPISIGDEDGRTIEDIVSKEEDPFDLGSEALSIARDLIHYAGKSIIDLKASAEQVKLFEQFLNLRRSERAITKSELIQIRATIGLPVAQFILIDYESLAQALLDDYLLLCERGLAANLSGHPWRSVSMAIKEDREAVSILRRQWKLIFSVAIEHE
jgi:hypothetical protein